MCGILGIIGTDAVARELYEGLHAIQHRGQDAAGIATFDGKFHLRKGTGLVEDIFDRKDLEILTGNLGIAHVRYPTIGLGSPEDAQPFYTNSPYGIALAHNGNVTNYAGLRNELACHDLRQLNSCCDAEAVLNVFAPALFTRDWTLPLPDQIFGAVGRVFERVKGSYSVVALIANVGLVAFRDPFGIKPAIFGEREGPDGQKSYAVASESVALDILGFGNKRDLDAGEAVYVDLSGNVHRRQVAPPNHHPCVFELVYFARPDSFLDRISVYKTRQRMGEALAEEWRKTGIRVDSIIPVPESARTSALAMAQALGVKYTEGLIKNRYVGRTFIMPGQARRESSIRRKLNPIRLEFQAKDVLLVDDSIVRGSTSRKIVSLAREAGARRVYFASCCPPLRFPCVYGIDMATRKEFIARDRSVEEVANLIGADHLVYLPLDALNRAGTTGNPEIARFCNACFTGEYPTGDVTPEMFDEIERERLEAHDIHAEGVQRVMSF